MIITVTDEKEINDCQKSLCAILETNLTNKQRCRFGVPGSSGSYLANYNDKIWWFYHIWKEAKHGSAFGSCPLSITKSNEINLEINFPLRGIKRNISSLFAKDTIRQEYLILHRGKFHRRSKEDFDKFYDGQRIEVYDGDQRNILYYVSNITKEENIITEIMKFMHEVVKFKNACPITK